MSDEIAKLLLERAEDIFLLRQSGRSAAAALGCDETDQIRLATALSEIGRETVSRGSRARAILSLEHSGSLVVTVECFPLVAIEDAHQAAGVNAARKLVEELTITGGPTPATVTLRILRSPGPGLAHTDATQLKALLATTCSISALDKVRLENQDLITTLEHVKEQRRQLAQLNSELEATNHGVMAMYAQLADELEATNRGVVALYAELDDTTQRLNHANEAKSRFLASVSHELRSPVSSIMGLTSLLLDADAETLSDDQRTQMHFIQASAKSLLELVNELLDLAKAESGKLEPQPTPINLNDLFAELQGALRPLARPGVTFEVQATPLPQIESDRSFLLQIVRNLLTNALKFTSSGYVKLYAEQPTPDCIDIIVADTGIGIAPEDQVRVFEEFYQVRGPLQVRQQGTGLGLPYVQRVTKALGGTLRLESTLGHGTIINVTLPVRYQPSELPLATSVPPPLSETKTGTILVIDDDDGFRNVLKGCLHHTATCILEAANGLEALRIMRNHRPDLLFLDLRMPQMDGPEFIAALQADPDLQDIPYIVVTSNEIDDPQPANLPGAGALLAKSQINRRIVHEAMAKALK